MSPQEKAQQLCRSYWHYFTAEPSVNYVFRHAKQCALIAVDEIIGSIPNNYTFKGAYLEYWQQVKTEIEKL